MVRPYCGCRGTAERGSAGYPPAQANYIVGGKRPLSSMTPTIVERNGALYLALGASGGSRIISAVYQVIVQSLKWSRNVLDAVSLPRFHDQLLPVVRARLCGGALSSCWCVQGLQVEFNYDVNVAAWLASLGHQVLRMPGACVCSSLLAPHMSRPNQRRGSTPWCRPCS